MTTLSKAIESIAAKARKRVAETGSLHGFSANYRDLSGSAVTALSVSAIAADDGSTTLTYTVDRDNAAGPAIKGEQDPAHLIEELMDFFNKLKRASRRQQPVVAPLRAHA
jgi:hypothetical protein